MIEGITRNGILLMSESRPVTLLMGKILLQSLRPRTLHIPTIPFSQKWLSRVIYVLKSKGVGDTRHRYIIREHYVSEPRPLFVDCSSIIFPPNPNARPNLDSIEGISSEICFVIQETGQ